MGKEDRDQVPVAALATPTGWSVCVGVGEDWDLEINLQEKYFGASGFGRKLGGKEA